MAVPPIAKFTAEWYSALIDDATRPYHVLVHPDEYDEIRAALEQQPEDVQAKVKLFYSPLADPGQAIVFPEPRGWI